MSIDRGKFFGGATPYAPLEFLLQKLDTSAIQLVNQQAYVLATIKHETANTFLPIREIGTEAYLKSKPYWPYIGRGYVQITWKDNYKRFGKLFGLDFVNHPEQVLEKEISWQIAELGMTKGLFTGVKLSDFINDEKTDYINARKIINGLDCAEKIADYAKIFEVSLS